jgi:NTP pyrophosphatase (non-canonical NTP hydrolase)
MKTEEEKLYRATVRKFGPKHQMVKCMEELGELIQALAKYHDTADYATWCNVMEEMVDVRIMLNQMDCIFEDKKRKKELKEQKLERLWHIVHEMNPEGQ